MGLFGGSKKNQMYEKNARINELESKIEAMTEKMEKLKLENAELRAKLGATQAEKEALENENMQLGSNLKSLRKKESEEGLSDEDDEDHSRLRDLEKIRKEKEKATEFRLLAMEKYALELKRLKLFSQKWQAYFSERDQMEVQELINLLHDLLDSDKSVDETLSEKEKVDKIYAVLGEPIDPESLIKEHFDSEDTGFNIDDAINPKGELNLEDLCKELGVFDG